MNILGISCYYHDSAAALIQDGNIIAAAQEERFTRKKHDPNFPTNAIEYCLKEAKLTHADIDLVCFYDKPFLKFERILETYLGFVPKGIQSAWKSLPIWIKDKLWIADHIQKQLDKEVKVIYPEHHESHAASAFFPSPFQQAAVLTMDGVGEWATSSIGFGDGNKLKLTHELQFPHSLGLLYSAFTYYTGFKVNSGEYKVMGLAPYGTPKYVKQIYDHLIDLKEDGSFAMNMEYFDFAAGLKMTSSKLDGLFGGAPRKSESKLTQREMDLAASVQEVTEEIMLRMTKTAVKDTGSKNVCLAGGVALNCVGNGKILRSGIVDNLWIQPAAGDAGGALGAALVGWYSYLGNERKVSGKLDSMQGSYLGPAFSNEDIQTWLKKEGIPFHFELDDSLFDTVSGLLAQENVVGWFNGRMEFGPRALGGRSILGDPRSENMQKTLNLKIKYRESFRPFAPSVLAEKVSDVFDLDRESPYMLLVAPVKKERCFDVEDGKSGMEKLYQKRSDLPSITHVDYSARVQTVHKETNPRYYNLISSFYKKTGVPVLINTSFNVRGEPIVCTPEEAFTCFMRTEMDVLVLENCILYKHEQKAVTKDESWKNEFELD
ncbi:hypothetical protein EP331_11060 [bacterium]|nr:MAG: hypothetical protein EP331_11060 [bacterium]